MSNKCEFLHNRATLSMLSYLDDVPQHSTMYVRRTSILLKKEMKTKEIGLFFIPSNMSNVTHVNSQDLSNSIDTAYKLRSYNLIDFVDILVTRTHTESHISILMQILNIISIKQINRTEELFFVARHTKSTNATQKRAFCTISLIFV